MDLTRVSVVEKQCQRPRPAMDWNTGRRRLIPCGRPRCSWECRNLWAKKMAAALRRSFESLPPTHFVRVTMLDPIKPRNLSLCLGKFLRRLRRRDCEYFALNEWHEGRRHHHILVRTDGKLSSAVVACCGERRVGQPAYRVIAAKCKTWREPRDTS